LDQEKSGKPDVVDNIRIKVTGDTECIRIALRLQGELANVIKVRFSIHITDLEKDFLETGKKISAFAFSIVLNLEPILRT
jgi:hypothetical protein